MEIKLLITSQRQVDGVTRQRTQHNLIAVRENQFETDEEYLVYRIRQIVSSWAQEHLQTKLVEAVDQAKSGDVIPLKELADTIAIPE